MNAMIRTSMCRSTHRTWSRIIWIKQELTIIFRNLFKTTQWSGGDRRPAPALHRQTLPPQKRWSHRRFLNYMAKNISLSAEPASSSSSIHQASSFKTLDKIAQIFTEISHNFPHCYVVVCPWLSTVSLPWLGHRIALTFDPVAMKTASLSSYRILWEIFIIKSFCVHLFKSCKWIYRVGVTLNTFMSLNDVQPFMSVNLICCTSWKMLINSWDSSPTSP